MSPSSVESTQPESSLGARAAYQQCISSTAERVRDELEGGFAPSLDLSGHTWEMSLTLVAEMQRRPLPACTATRWKLVSTLGLDGGAYIARSTHCTMSHQRDGCTMGGDFTTSPALPACLRSPTESDEPPQARGDTTLAAGTLARELSTTTHR